MKKSLVAIAISVYWPMTRRHNPVGIIHNGGRKRVLECIVCGAQESYCTEWPEPKCVQSWRYRHDRDCGRALVERLRKEKPVDAIAKLISE